MRISTPVAAIAATAALGLAAAPVLAQDATTDTSDATDSTSGDDAAADDAPFGPRARHGEMAADLAEDLAAELGLDEQEVADALDTVREAHRAEMQQERAVRMQEHLDEAVADGRLTREQADALAALREAGDGPRARDTSWEDRLAAAVEDGTLTQDQADALADLEPGPGGPGHRGGHGPHGDAGPS